MTLREAILDILRDPVGRLIRRWNWKSALFSFLLRGSIFLAANFSAGWEAVRSVLLTEFVLRSTTSGVNGSIVQSLRKVEPPWQAAVAVMGVLPILQHTLELTVHWARGTPNLITSFLSSAAFTALAVLFNLYAMRRGTMIVGDGQRTLLEDLKSIPSVVIGFIATGAVLIKRGLTGRLITTAVLVCFLPLHSSGGDFPYTNQREVQWYRADAVIRILSIPICKKKGVGSGFALFEAEGPASSRCVRLQFGAGSLPEQAAGLNRLGHIEEVVTHRQDKPWTAGYFGFMTTSDEQSVSQARRSLADTNAKTTAYSVIRAEMRPGACTTTKTRFHTDARFSWEDWSGLVPQAHAAARTPGAETASRDCPWTGEGSAPVSMLYSVLRSIDSDQPRQELRFVWGDQEYTLKTQKKIDPSVGRKLAARALTQSPDRIMCLTGKTRNTRTHNQGQFRLWYEAGRRAPLPLRIEYRPRSFLELVFEADPSLVSQLPNSYIPTGGFISDE